MIISLGVNKKVPPYIGEYGEEDEESIPTGTALTKEEAIKGLQCSRPFDAEKYSEKALEDFYWAAKALGFKFVAL